MSLTPDEIRAAAETHNELGPEYQSAVIESFLDKVGREIDARVDARLGYRPGPQQPMMPYAPAQAPVQHQHPNRSAFALAVLSMVFGIPLTGIVVGNHYNIAALIVVWIALLGINVAYGLHSRPPGDNRR
ncbi:MAG TPA: hypothetical protein VMA95_14590 [Streptosporangiaceae bacterium]|nr:hypothetical protein [Streptosporangiaceae bacterium]